MLLQNLLLEDMSNGLSEAQGQQERKRLYTQSESFQFSLWHNIGFLNLYVPERSSFWQLERMRVPCEIRKSGASMLPHHVPSSSPFGSALWKGQVVRDLVLLWALEKQQKGMTAWLFSS